MSLAPRLLILLLLAAPSMTTAQDVVPSPPVLPAPGDPPPSEVERRPLSVEIEGPLSFSKLTLGNATEGSAVIDPATGTRRVTGGLRESGGLSLRGRARITGEPFSAVVISFPNRIEMRSTSGATAELSGFETNIAGMAVLDSNGVLIFDFGGRMEVKGRIFGIFRASIPISVTYP